MTWSIAARMPCVKPICRPPYGDTDEHGNDRLSHSEQQIGRDQQCHAERQTGVVASGNSGFVRAASP
jgi:hypothetical protein